MREAVVSSIEVDSNETCVFNLSQKNYRQDVFYNFNTNVCISDMQNIRKRVLICLQYYIYYMLIFFVNNHSCTGHNLVNFTLRSESQSFTQFTLFSL